MIFVDTSAWVAVNDRKDVNHEKAIKFIQQLKEKRQRLVTTNYILDEAFTLMLGNIGYLETVEFKNSLDKLVETKLLILLQIDSRLQQEAWKIFLKFNIDKKWSYTDCTSKAIMSELAIYEAFTFDHHFEQMGFIKRP